jgi:hypothetical protein
MIQSHETFEPGMLENRAGLLFYPFRSLTPGPPPFSGMNSTPAASSAVLIAPTVCLSRFKLDDRVVRHVRGGSQVPHGQAEIEDGELD